MRSYCYYEGNCFNLGLNSLFLTFPDGKELEIIKGQFLLQQSDPFICEIMIQALPDEHMHEKNEVDMIIG
jgi:hypothetical protein